MVELIDLFFDDVNELFPDLLYIRRGDYFFVREFLDELFDLFFDLCFEVDDLCLLDGCFVV